MKRARRRNRSAAASVLAVLIAFLNCTTTGCSQKPSLADVDQEARSSLASTFSDATETIRTLMLERGWPGVAIAVVDRERVLWSETFGETEKGTGIPVDSRTVFSIGSITKTVTSTAVMIAVQEGLVDLDTPITAYLPDFSVNSRWEEHPEQRITLRLLLNHTAGFTHEAPVGNNFNPASPSWQDHIESISSTWLKFPVGERYSYSNLGIEVAAYIVQETSGQPFEVFVRDRLFEPLEMQSSFVNTPQANGNCQACAVGHNRWFESLPTYIPMEGAGGLRMTLTDAVRYVQFHLNRGRVADKPILEARFFDEMDRPSVQITTAVPMLRYGLGFYLWGDFAETYSVHHQGTGFGLSAVMRWYPEYGIGMAMFLNTVDRGRDWDIGSRLLKEVIESGAVTKLDDGYVPDAGRFFKQVEATKRNTPLSSPGETPYQDAWKKHLGTYCAVYGEGYHLRADIDTSSVCFRILEQDGYLIHDGGLHHGGRQSSQRLIEHEPGLFFTERSGESVDLRSDVPAFRSIALRKATDQRN